MLRILNIFPRFKTLSGAETLMLKLAHEVQELGHEMPILTRRCSKDCAPLIYDNIQIEERYGAESGVHLLDSAADVAGSMLLGRAIDDRDIDAICAWAPPALPALWYYRRIRNGNVPTIYYCLQPPEFIYTTTRQVTLGYLPLGLLVPALVPVYRHFDRRWYRAADGVMCLSTDYERRCQEIYGPSEIPVVPPGVDQDVAPSELVESLRGKYNIARERPLLVTANKLIPKKNVDLFIRTVAELRHRMSNVVGVIVGDGPERKRLETLVDRLGVRANIVFTGFVETHEEVSAWMRACDLFLFLERDVPFGMTPLEAGVQGTPTLAFRGGGTLDTIVDEETGRLVSPDDGATEVARAVLELLQNPSELKRTGRLARSHAGIFTWKACAEGFIKGIENIVEKRSVRNEICGSDSPLQ